MIDDELLSILACPVCKEEIEYIKEKEKLRCTKCKRLYPIREGIPIMLVEEAEVDNQYDEAIRERKS